MAWGKMVARFLVALAKDDEVSAVTDLLPKVIPTIKSRASVVAAMQCLGRHSRRDAALISFALLKNKGTLVHMVVFPSMQFNHISAIPSPCSNKNCITVFSKQRFL